MDQAASDDTPNKAVGPAFTSGQPGLEGPGFGEPGLSFCMRRRIRSPIVLRYTCGRIGEQRRATRGVLAGTVPQARNIFVPGAGFD